MEIWKEIPECAGNYQVSNIGNVRSKKRITRIGKYTRQIGGYVLKIFNRGKGYSGVNIYVNKKQVLMGIHILVARSFIPNPNNKPFVNHKNGIKTDNRVDNLEWVTCGENHKHAYAIGLKS